jgi:hypothetical protein
MHADRFQPAPLHCPSQASVVKRKAWQDDGAFSLELPPFSMSKVIF